MSAANASWSPPIASWTSRALIVGWLPPVARVEPDERSVAPVRHHTVECQFPAPTPRACQEGTAWRLCPATSWCWSLPSAFITNTGRLLMPSPWNARRNAIFVPSGDQAGPKSSPVAQGVGSEGPHPLSWCWLVPFGVHDPDAAEAGRVRDLGAVRTPVRDLVLERRIGREGVLVAAVGVHHPDLRVERVSVTVELLRVDERDLAAVRRPRREGVHAVGADTGAVGELGEPAARSLR